MNRFDCEMLKHLVCPVSGGKLVLSNDGEELICFVSNLAYPIHDGVPILRPDQASSYHGERSDDF